MNHGTKTTSTIPRLEYRAGKLGLLAPFVVMFAGIIWLGVQGLAIPEAFWPTVILALFVGLVLSRQKQLYVDSLISGIASSMLATMLLAWFLAGILGKLLTDSGLIQGLVWVAVKMGLPAAWFPLVAFVSAAILSLATGTSLGTLLAATPVLFPAGFLLGADPALLLGGIIGGAFVGDNLAPISDTTIVSAYSQGTDILRVVRSRLRYAIVATIVTVLAYVLFAVDSVSQETNPISGAVVQSAPPGLFMLLVPVLLIILVARGKHLVSALLYSIPFGFSLALALGQIHLVDLLRLDATTFTANGIVIEGIRGMLGVGVFTIFLMGLIGTLEPGGFIEWMVKQAERFATTPTRAEVAIVSSVLLTNALTTAGTPSMVLMGPFVRRLGHRFRIAPWRRGNLLDACSTTIIGFLPYSVAVLLPFSMVSELVVKAGVTDFTPVALVPYVFYCWALMLTIIFAALTGWGREKMTEEEFLLESREINTVVRSPDR